MKPLVFCGVSHNILTYAETAQRSGYTVAGIIDHDYYGNKDDFYGIPVIGSEESFLNWNDYCYFPGVNWSPHPTHARDTQKRLKFIKLLKQQDLQIVNLIDPSAIVSSTAKLGHGIYLGPNVVVEPNCEIDNYVQIHYNSSLSYGSTIGENSSIQNSSIIVAHIGTNTFIGMAVKIFPYFKPGYIIVGDNACIYPNSVLNEDIGDNDSAGFNH